MELLTMIRKYHENVIPAYSYLNSLGELEHDYSEEYKKDYISRTSLKLPFHETVKVLNILRMYTVEKGVKVIDILLENRFLINKITFANDLSYRVVGMFFKRDTFIWNIDWHLIKNHFTWFDDDFFHNLKDEDYLDAFFRASEIFISADIRSYQDYFVVRGIPQPTSLGITGYDYLHDKYPKFF